MSAPPAASRLFQRTLMVVGVVLFSVQATNAIQGVWRNKRASDFATYHYAAQVTWQGGDPYTTRALSQAARSDGTRKSVHPFFYPPPFLLGMIWDRGLSLSTAYRSWGIANLLALLASLAVLRRWLKAPWWLLAIVAGTLTPAFNAIKMGQANQLVLLPALVGLWLGRGSWVAGAAMAKMSPVLFLAGWAPRRMWRPVFGAVGTAAVLSLIALAIVPLDTQLRFYLDIMPGFSSGEYHGLRVPINLPANHSIPDLFHQLWPGPDNHHLHPRAAMMSKLISVLVLGGLAWVATRVHPKDVVAEAGLAGALTILMVVTPVYAYEHHLAWLVLPGVAVGVALHSGRLSSRWGWGAGLAWALSVLHLAWARALREAVPAPLDWVVQESKFAGLMGLLVVCVAAALSKAPHGSAAQPPN